MADLRKNQCAFRNIEDNPDEENVSLWINNSLLPTLSQIFSENGRPSLVDLAIGYTQFYRCKILEHENKECSFNEECLDIDGNSLRGVLATFDYSVLEAASHGLMNNSNPAAAKIGYEFRNIFRSKAYVTRNKVDQFPNEISWRGKGWFICGANAPSQSATIIFNRSTLLKLSQLITSHPLKDVFFGLSEILDPDSVEVDPDLDDTVMALSEDLYELQNG